ncbi:HAD hydrolase-like protein [Ruania suaedae]|uniref:HAD hydrolase-like protein n=1 Tax=Ruania suaedae TaxID=2897774 RepID=UPI001E567568|nr:HAD hydrolase-like protein [Ruania suaedae]UFU04351.1 HAD hydrolase-like protein [Ruania suaedae]
MRLPSPVTAVLLDLDGTIVDSGPGIVITVSQTLAELGLPAMDPQRLELMVGPPLPWSLEHVAGVPAARVQEAVTVYRRHYADGAMLEAPLFPGVRALVTDLSASGIPLALATSKPERYARQILDHAGLTEHFTAVCGALEDGPSSVKSVVVERALAALRAQSADTSGVVHVGDRIHDVEGAAVHGVPCVVVTWGYGATDDLSAAAATVGEPEDLRRLLGVSAPVAR